MSGNKKLQASDCIGCEASYVVEEKMEQDIKTLQDIVEQYAIDHKMNFQALESTEEKRFVDPEDHNWIIKHTTVCEEGNLTITVHDKSYTTNTPINDFGATIDRDQALVFHYEKNGNTYCFDMQNRQMWFETDGIRKSSTHPVTRENEQQSEDFPEIFKNVSQNMFDVVQRYVDSNQMLYAFLKDPCGFAERIYEVMDRCSSERLQ